MTYLFLGPDTAKPQNSIDSDLNIILSSLILFQLNVNQNVKLPNALSSTEPIDVFLVCISARPMSVNIYWTRVSRAFAIQILLWEEKHLRRNKIDENDEKEWK